MTKTFEIIITSTVFRKFNSDYRATKAHSLCFTFSFIAINRNKTEHKLEKWNIQNENNRNLYLKFCTEHVAYVEICKPLNDPNF